LTLKNLQLFLWKLSKGIQHWFTDTYIISYPKAGRTWLRVMIGKALCDHYGLPERFLLNTYRLTANTCLPRTQFSHDFSSIRYGYHFQQLKPSKAYYRDKRVLLLFRNVKDLAVSNYFQAAKRQGKFIGSVSEFIRSDQFGVRKIVTFYNDWHGNQNAPKEFMLTRYEDLYREPFGELSKIVRFLRFNDLNESNLKSAIEYADFEKMQKREQAGKFESKSLLPGDVRDQDSYKVRKGGVGKYSEYLSAEDIEYIDWVISEYGCPFENEQ
jgi:hypothetical protein